MLQNACIDCHLLASAMQAKGGAVIVARKQGQKQPQQSDGGEDQDRSRMSRDIVKAVLASPLTIPWPNLPKHLQDATARALPLLLPPEVADYHVSRQRCQQQDKKIRRKDERSAKRSAGSNRDTAQGEEIPAGSSDQSASPAAKDETRAGTKRKAAGESNSATVATRPSPPAILDHLVLGINETIKALERQIADIEMEMMIMADHLNSRTGKSPTSNSRSSTNASLPAQRFLPTAPDSAEPTEPAEGDPAAVPPASVTISQARPKRPLEKPRPEPVTWILIPLPQINPPALVAPIPQYCATYNSLVYQHAHLRKVFHTRTPEKEWTIAGEEKREVRVVPLGRVEEDMATHAGLRRLACLGIRASHPAHPKLDELLPKSILHPPRHSVTVPFPVSSLKVHSSTRDTDKRSTEAAAPAANDGGQSQQLNGPLPLPHVHYAPLHVKGITTTVPADSGARKARRLAEVRERRLKIKEKKKEERAKLVREALGQKDKRERKKGHERGRKAAKAADRQAAAPATAST